MPRVTPVAGKADVSPEHQAVVDDVLKVFGAVRGPFSMMLHSPEMTKRMLPLVPFFRDESVVDGKLRSVGVLAAVREREAAYVWAAQVAAARRNGVVYFRDAETGDEFWFTPPDAATSDAATSDAATSGIPSHGKSLASTTRARPPSYA